MKIQLAAAKERIRTAQTEATAAGTQETTVSIAIGGARTVTGEWGS